MKHKVEYKNEEERKQIIDTNNSLFLVEEQNITTGNFLIFIDTDEYNAMIQTQEINTRASNIKSYLDNSDTVTITSIENSILEIEKNRILGGI
jgi:hypothetical protein